MGYTREYGNQHSYATQSKHNYGRRVVYRDIELLDDSSEKWSSVKVIDHKPAPDGRHCIKREDGVKEWVNLRESNWRFKHPYAEVKRSVLEFYKTYFPTRSEDDLNNLVDGILKNPAYINRLPALANNLKTNFKDKAKSSGLAFPNNIFSGVAFPDNIPTTEADVSSS